jgi:hypothetical protein
MLKGEPAQLMKDGSASRGEVAAMGIIETGKEALMINNSGMRRGDPEEDDNGVAICTSTLNSKSPATLANEELAGVAPETGGPEFAASPLLPCYPVGRRISLPFGQVLPQCCYCSCNALITLSNRSDLKENSVVCLDHGLEACYDIRDLKLLWSIEHRYRFISPEHEAALRAFLA